MKFCSLCDEEAVGEMQLENADPEIYDDGVMHVPLCKKHLAEAASLQPKELIVYFINHAERLRNEAATRH